MVQFKVNDTVVLCASINDFCGLSNNYYYLHDINASLSPCNISLAVTNGCLSLSGVQLEFQWSNSSGSAEKHTCTSTQNLKTLGIATTDAQGVASIQYIITQADLALYNANTSLFDLRVCIRNTNVIQSNFSGVRNDFRTVDPITIVQDRCLGVTCVEKCFGTDLWGTKCDVSTGTCIQDVLKQQNSLLCTATHVLKYDINFLPTSFKDLIAPSIVSISNGLGNYLVMPAGIQYLGATYSNGIFNIYVKQILASLSTSQTLTDLTGIIGGALCFILGALIVVATDGLGIVVGATVAAFGTYLILYNIEDLTGGLSTTGKTTAINNSQLTADGTEFSKGVIAGIVTTGCSDPTLTQDQKAACIKNNSDNFLIKWKSYIGKIYPDADHTPLSNAVTEIQNCYDIYNGSSKTQQNYQDFVSCLQLKSSEELDKDKNNVLAVYPADAPAGSKSTTTDCWISSPISDGCIISTKYKNIVVVGGVIIGGYLLYKLIK